MTRNRSYLVATLALALAAVAWAASPATAPSDEVKITVKTAPPVVVSTTPQAGAVDVDSVTSGESAGLTVLKADHTASGGNGGDAAKSTSGVRFGRVGTGRSP